jgi:aldehyde:ferredoxin oxidoreductase
MSLGERLRQPIPMIAGRVMHVNLNTHSVEEIHVEPEIYRQFLGGRGFNQYMLAKHILTSPRPDTASIPVLISPGLLVGTSTPGAVRISLDSVNRFSGGIGSANAGGDFARSMKSTGIGTLILSGQSDTPCYIELANGHVRIHDAREIWGRRVGESTDILTSRHGSSCHAMCIGPAGERGVRAGCVIVDRSRAAAKCGIGATLGEKRVKAVVAVPGDFRAKLAFPEQFRKLAQHLWEKALASPASRIMSEHGTICGINTKNPFGAAPFRHYQDGFMDPDRIIQIDERAFKILERRRFGPEGCPFQCRATYHVEDGEYAGSQVDAIQANSIQDFGIKLDIVDPGAIIHAQMLCNEYGMDIDTAAETIAWACECFEKQLLSHEDTDGLTLRFDDPTLLSLLIERIATKVGFGSVLAEGSYRAAGEFGGSTKALVAAMKQQDLYEAVQIPRGYGLGAALSTRGGGHCSGSPFTESYPGLIDQQVGESVYGVPTAGIPSVYEGKGKLVAFHERLHSINNALGVCGFLTIWQRYDLLDLKDLAQLVSFATGWDMDATELSDAGERIHTLERWVNSQYAGLGREDDLPPERFFTSRVQRGPYAGVGLERQAFEAMLDENYHLHQWGHDGRPTRWNLDRQGLKEFDV